MASINNAGCSTAFLIVTSNKEHEGEAIDETTNQMISKKAGGTGRGGWAEYAVVWWRTVAEIRHMMSYLGDGI